MTEQPLKVRLNRLADDNYQCWLDGETTYYYGRSLLNTSDPSITKKEHGIDIWLESIQATFKKSEVTGCYPEWKIDFKYPKDITMFKMKWID